MFTHIHFDTIRVVDSVRAIAFYRDILGFEVERDDPYGDGRWIFMRLAGANTLLHFDQRDTVDDDGKPALVLVTADVDATIATLRQRGVIITHEPQNAPWNPGTRWAMIRDSEGNSVLIQTI